MSSGPALPIEAPQRTWSRSALPSNAQAVRALILLGVFGFTLAGLHTILSGYAWWLLSMLVGVLVFGAGVAVRALFGQHRVMEAIVAPIVGLVAVAVMALLRFASDTTVFGVVPTGASFDRFRILIRDAGYSITWQRVPARADEAILFVLVLGVAALFFLAEVFVFSLRQPALSGLPLAAVFLTPGLTPEGSTDGWIFAASTFGFFAFLLIGTQRRVITALGIAALAIVGALVIPAALPATDITATSSKEGPSVSTGVNPILHLGDNLRNNNENLVFTYSTVSGTPEYFRLMEISDFNGTSWAPARPKLEDGNRPESFPRPSGLASGVTTGREVSYVHVANLHSPWLPVPYPASKITGLKGTWRYVPESFTVASNDSLARGQDYAVSSIRVTPTPKQLLAAGNTAPEGFDAYLALPSSTPAMIKTTAQNVTSGEFGAYQQALALQGYLRSSRFEYSETAPVSDGYDTTGVQYVADFLKQHRGYCIHFASAMAVMARELGIPSRIIVGFQPGQTINGDDNGRKIFAVEARDLHAWPELYFSGIGWVPFEPTPGRGSVPDYANPTVAGVPTVGTNTEKPPVAGNGVNPGSHPRISDGSASRPWIIQGNGSNLSLLGGILVAVVGLLFLPAAMRGLRRRKLIASLRSGQHSASAGWREMVETCEDSGIAIGSTLTPHEVADRLRRIRGMGDEGSDALDRLCHAVEVETFGRPGALHATGAVREATASASGAVLAQDLSMILTKLQSSVIGRDRLRAVMLPPSLVSRVRSTLSRFA